MPRATARSGQSGNDRDGHRAGGRRTDETSDVVASSGVCGVARRGGGDGAAELQARRRRRRAHWPTWLRAARRFGAQSSRSSSPRCFPEKSREEVERIARASYGHLGRTTIETAVLPSYSRAQILDLFEEVSGWSLVEERLARGKGLIVVTGHLGNWELGGAYLAARGLPIDAVARHMNNPLFDTYLTATRQQIGMTVVHDDQAVRRVPRSLRSGRAVAFLVDQGAIGLASTLGAVLRSIREDAARSRGVRATTRHADRLRCRAAPAIGRYALTFEPIDVQRYGRPRGRRRSHRHGVHGGCSSGGCVARRNSICGIIGAGSISVLERHASWEIRCHAQDDNAKRPTEEQ